MDKEKASKDQKSSGSIVPVLACVLNQLCVSNDQMPFSPKESNSKFHALRIPYINLREYLERIAKYSGCSTECLVLALVYIDRIIQGSQSFIVNSYCIHRLLITSVMLAAKFFDDHYYNNAYYAKVGGVTYAEMNALEVEFLFMLNFDLFVTTETYKQYYDELWNHANSTPAHLCGCINAKVPLLILPRFDEYRKPPTMLDDSDLVDQSDLDIIEDSPPSTPATLEIRPLSSHCGTKIQTNTTSTSTSTLTSHPPKPVQTSGVKRVSVTPDLSNPATWHVSPSIPVPSVPVKHDRIIAPPPFSNKTNNGTTHEIKNPTLPFSSAHSFHFQEQQQLPLPYSKVPVAYEETNPFSSMIYNQLSSYSSATQGRDDVMLDIIIDHNTLTRPTTSQIGNGSRFSTSMLVESPTTGGSDTGYYGNDFSSFLSNTDSLDENEDERQMIDHKGCDLSPTFHPYGMNQKFNYAAEHGLEFGGGSRHGWKNGTTSSSNRLQSSHYSSGHGVDHLPSNVSSKRKNNNRGETNLWQSIVLPVY